MVNGVAWHGSRVRHDVGRANTDFGSGFYAFSYQDPRSYESAVKRARQEAVRGGGTPIVVVAAMRLSDFERLRQADFRTPPWSARYDDVVNQSRKFPGKDVLAAEGVDVAIGPVARRQGNCWVPNLAYPDQYAFKTAISVSYFRPVCVVQVDE